MQPDAVPLSFRGSCKPLAFAMGFMTLHSPLPLGEALGVGAARYQLNVNEASSGWKTSVLVPSKLAMGLAHSIL